MLAHLWPLFSSIAQADPDHDALPTGWNLIRKRLDVFKMLEGGQAGEALRLGTEMLKKFDASDIQPSEMDPCDRQQMVKIVSICSDACKSLGNQFQRRALLERLLQMQESTINATLPDEAVRILDTLQRLGDCYHRLGNIQKVEKVTKRAMEFCETHFGPDHVHSIPTMRLLASIRDDWPEKRRLAGRCVAIAEQGLGSQHQDLWPHLQLYGMACVELEDLEESQEVLDRCLKIQEQHFVCTNRPEIVPTLFHLGRAWLGLRDFQQSKEVLERCLRIQKLCSLKSPNQEEVSDQELTFALQGGTLVYLGIALESLGNKTESSRSLDRAMKIFEEHSKAASRPLELARALVNNGCLCNHLGMHKRAKELTELALQLFREHRPNDPDVKKALQILAESENQQYHEELREQLKRHQELKFLEQIESQLDTPAIPVHEKVPDDAEARVLGRDGHSHSGAFSSASSMSLGLLRQVL